MKQKAGDSSTGNLKGMGQSFPLYSITLPAWASS